MRILFLTYNFTLPGQPGSLRAYQIGRHLAEAGHHVTVLTSAVNYMVGGDGKKTETFRFDRDLPLEIVELQSPIANPRKSKAHRILHDIIVALKQFKAALLKVGQVDLVLSASPPILTPLMAIIISKIYKIPHVFEVRDILSDGLMAAGIIRFKGFVRLIELLEKTCFSFSNGLVAVTPGIRRVLLKKGVADSKIKLITNGVEDELYDSLPNNADARRQWRLSNDAFVVVFAGTLSNFSNVGLLLEAARLLSKTGSLFLIAGEGQKRKEYERFCLVHGIDHVRFLGAVSRDRIPSLCVAADICVHMFKEGEFWDIFFSNKMFDYMGAGRPVVYSGGGDSAALIRDANGGLVVKADLPQALADGMHYFLKSPKKKEMLGKNAREYVLKYYSRKKLMGRMTSYLETIAANP